MNPLSKYLLGILMLLTTLPVGIDPPYDPRPTVITQVCVDVPHSGDILFKAQNDKRRFIVRSTHCWKT
jgi:hypothetical protein